MGCHLSTPTETLLSNLTLILKDSIGDNRFGKNANYELDQILWSSNGHHNSKYWCLPGRQSRHRILGSFLHAVVLWAAALCGMCFILVRSSIDKFRNAQHS